MSEPRVHPEAEAEFLAAVRHYEESEPGLGDTFDDAVAEAVADILWNPSAWPKLPGWNRLPVVRSRKVEVFPYRIVFLINEEVVTILAIAHQRRRPHYWNDRAAD